MRARFATVDDAGAIAAVHAAVAAEERWIATEPPVDVDAIAERFREMVTGVTALWVLEDGDGRIVGHLALGHAGVAGVVALGMAIHADARGRGGGRALMDAAMAWAADQPDLHKVELEVWPDNARAIALYVRYGFEVEGLRRDHYRRRDGSLRSALIMARLLPRDG